MFEGRNVKIGISPIGWTNDDLPDLGGENTFEQCISEMALAGFEGCEVGNKYPRDVAVLKRKLGLRGLTICNQWFPTYFTSRPYEETIERFLEARDRLHALGARVVGASEQGNSIQVKDLPVMGKDKPVLTDKQWETIIRGYEEMGKLAREKDMFFAVHHHMGTGIQTEEEIDRLMQNTDPELVFLVFCIGHARFAGIDPERLLRKYVSRVRHVHLKDVRENVLSQVQEKELSFLDAVRAGVFTIPGDGCVDFDPLLRILDENGYSGWLLVEAEQDPALADPFEYALRARAYLREHTGR